MVSFFNRNVETITLFISYHIMMFDFSRCSFFFLTNVKVFNFKNAKKKKKESSGVIKLPTLIWL